MSLSALQRSVSIMPRYDNNKTGTKTHYHIGGKQTCFAGRVLPRAVDIPFRKIADRVDPIENGRFTVEHVDVVAAHTKMNLWFLHFGVKVATLEWLARSFAWQKWSTRPGRVDNAQALPIVIKYQGRIIIWNGTHRTVICILAGKKLRCRLVNLDAIIKEDARARQAKAKR